jgi:hypothetical protein
MYPMLSRRNRLSWRELSTVGIAFILTLSPLHAFTLEDLLADTKMTPKRFANRFEDFDFEYHAEVQPVEQFLRRQRGDCDDYAILADYVLSRKHYDTMLIRIVLVGTDADAHDVCFVTQVKAYLDYNNRIYVKNLQRSGRRLREIADKVADSFDANWTSASLYTYNYDEDIKHMKLVVVKTDPPAEDPDAGGAAPAAGK